MRALVAWDNPAEAELLSLYLNLDAHRAVITTKPAEFLELAGQESWDVILMALNLPDLDGAFAILQRLRHLQPDCPIVGACHPVEVFRLARFLTHGMRSYLLRDSSGDFVFLVRSALEGAIEAVQAEREKQIAERLREEIESVRKLQESMIPYDFTCPEGYQACGRYEPSQIQVLGGRPVVMAGGDYYDLFAMDERHLVILVGDASGHGMKACMSIFTMHTLVRMLRGQRYRDTAEFVSEINRRLCEQGILTANEGFITLLYGILDAQTHTFQWTSAGHPLPLLFSRDNGQAARIGTSPDDTDLPLGLSADTVYSSHRISIPASTRMLVYTDGLDEAFRHGEEHCKYGLDGVIRTLQRTASRPLPEVLAALFQDSFGFTQGAGRHDDTTVVLLERL